VTQKCALQCAVTHNELHKFEYAQLTHHNNRYTLLVHAYNLCLAHTSQQSVHTADVCARQLQVKEGVVKLAGQRRAEAIANYGVVGIGIIMGVMGAVISVLESFFPHVLGI
jgi:hypothetical protein